MSKTLRLRRDALEWREIEGEIVAVDARDSVYLAVNRSGAVLWPELAQGTTAESLQAALIERFGLDEATAAGDVETFVQMLRDRNLLDAGTA
jgi:hypothetical protein